MPMPMPMPMPMLVPMPIPIRAVSTTLAAARRGAVLPRRAWLMATAMALYGCASGPRSPAQGSTVGRDVPRNAPQRPHPLAVERDWLRSWFEGTPVTIAQRDDGPLSIEVPLAFSFAPNRSAVKPALAAVLDKLAQSLRRTGALLPGLAAPPDAGGPPALALQRAGALRAYLLARGVPVAQLGTPAAAPAATPAAAPAATPAAAVQLRVEMPPL